MLFAQMVDLAGINFYDLIFKQVLQIQRCTGGGKYGCLTGSIPHDLLYALILPHIVFIVLLFLIARSPFFGGHKGIGNLVAMGIYIFVVVEGWYGAFLAPLFIFWLILTIFTTLGYFFLTRITWRRPSERFSLGKAAMERLKESAFEKPKDLRAARELLDKYKDMREQLDKDEDPELYKQLTKEIVGLQTYIEKKERGLK